MKISKILTCFVLFWAKRLFIVFNIIVMDSNEKEQSAGKAEKQGRSFNFLHLVQLISKYRPCNPVTLLHWSFSEALRLVIFDSDPKEEAKLKRMAASLGCEVVTKYDTGSPPTRTVLKDSNSYIYAFAAHCRQRSEFLPNPLFLQNTLA